MKPAPLCVDLDGTLIDTDVFRASVLELACRSPMRLLSASTGLLRGRPGFKKRVANTLAIDPHALRYNPRVVEMIAAARRQGCLTVLATGADQRPAHTIADHLGFFDRVIASDGRINMTGRNKAKALVALFGPGNFDYVGNSVADIEVWRHCRRIYVVSRNARFIRQLRIRFDIAEVIGWPDVSPGPEPH